MATFLVVDKSQVVLEVLDFTIERFGHQVFITKDPLEAKMIFTQKHIDIVMLNVQLDNYDGIELAKELMQIRNSIFLIMSNTDSHELKHRAKKANISGWILKPFIPERLIKMTIKTFLNQLEI